MKKGRKKLKNAWSNLSQCSLKDEIFVLLFFYFFFVPDMPFVPYISANIIFVCVCTYISIDFPNSWEWLNWEIKKASVFWLFHAWMTASK